MLHQAQVGRRPRVARATEHDSVVGQGIANQIQVVGEVARPQSISYRDGLRLLDVIVAVGGVSPFAAELFASESVRVWERAVS